MPTRLCLEPRCPNPQTGKGRCDAHRKPIERERSRKRRVYKTKRWELARRHVLNRDPICKVCDNALSVEVDHIVPLSQGGDPYNPAGLQGICSPCDWAKSAGENARRVREGAA